MADSIMKAEEIKVLTIDGTTYVVSELSENIQRLVQIYNVWRQQQVEARMEVTKVDSALRNLSNEIVATLQKEQQEAEELSDANAPEAEGE